MNKRGLLGLLVLLGIFLFFAPGKANAACPARIPECPSGCNAGLLRRTNSLTVNTCWTGIPLLSSPCGPVNVCHPSTECTYTYDPQSRTCQPDEKTSVYTCLTETCDTAIGPVPANDLKKFVEFFLQYAMAISGGIILLMMIFTGYTVLTSGGNPEKLQGAKENVIAIFSGLLLIIFSQVLLRAVGADILNLPGF